MSAIPCTPVLVCGWCAHSWDTEPASGIGSDSDWLWLADCLSQLAQFLWGKDLNISCCGLSFIWDPMTEIFVIFWHISCPFPGEIVNFYEELFLTPGFGSYNGDLWLSSEAKTLITYEVMKASRDPSRLGSLWFIAILCALNAINKI